METRLERRGGGVSGEWGGVTRFLVAARLRSVGPMPMVGAAHGKCGGRGEVQVERQAYEEWVG